MDRRNKQVLFENGIYVVFWGCIFLVPIFNFNYNHHHDFQWTVVFRGWLQLIPFLFLFILNNYIFVPQIILKRKQWPTYLLVIAIAILLTFGTTFFLHEKEFGKFRLDLIEMQEKFPDSKYPSNGMNFPIDGMKVRDAMQRDGIHKEGNRPPFFFIGPDFRFTPLLGDMLIAILFLGCNLAVKLQFKSIRDDWYVKDLQQQNLQTQLINLKDQINPHFFMNTLNNIHALIDMDTEKAKDVLIQLSKLMRYVLYESNQAKSLLEKELNFLENYVALMSLRYTDQLDLTFNSPKEVPSVMIPPMLFVSFIENAFKYGVSYQHPSYIHILLELHGGIFFAQVKNSCFKRTVNEKGGIGIENTRKRLDLIFKDNYTLDIVNNENEFSVTMIIPIES